MQKLFSEFNPTTANQWKEQLAKDLKGVDFNQLVWHTNNNIDVNPFYTKEDLKETAVQVFNHSDWDICEHIMVFNEKEANAKALKALEGGASGIVFFIHQKINFQELIKNISLEHIYSEFFLGYDALHVIDDLKSVYGKINPADKKLKCFISIDPLCWYVFNGKWNKNQSEDFSVLDKLVHIPVNGSLYQECGANTISELAITLAHLNEYLNYLSEKKTLSNQTIHVNFSIGSDFFNEIAKLRAARKLIDLLVKQYDMNLPVHVHTQTTQVNNSSLDANNNMLRTTTEAMSAVIGGCNSLVIFPYNFVYEATTDFSNRIARNQQHILKEESYLNKMADASAGSYYLETLTDSIAEKAWEQFKTIEAKGGFIACVKNNFIQDLISKDAQVIKAKVKSGEIVLVGVNKFQNKNDKVIISAPMPDVVNPEINAIRPIRYSQSFEQELATTEKM